MEIALIERIKRLPKQTEESLRDAFSVLMSIEDRKSVDGYVKWIRSEAKKIRSAENKAARLTAYVDYILAGDKFKSSKVNVSYRKSEQIECADMLMVDPDYLRFKEPELDKKKIKDAIKAGIEVKGCQLVERQNVQIR